MITEVEFFYDNSFHFGFLSLDSETEINIFSNQNGVKKKPISISEMKCNYGTQSWPARQDIFICLFCPVCEKARWWELIDFCLSVTMN